MGWQALRPASRKRLAAGLVTSAAPLRVLLRPAFVDPNTVAGVRRQPTPLGTSFRGNPTGALCKHIMRPQLHHLQACFARVQVPQRWFHSGTVRLRSAGKAAVPRNDLCTSDTAVAEAATTWALSELGVRLTVLSDDRGLFILQPVTGEPPMPRDVAIALHARFAPLKWLAFVRSGTLAGQATMARHGFICSEGTSCPAAAELADCRVSLAAARALHAEHGRGCRGTVSAKAALAFNARAGCVCSEGASCPAAAQLAGCTVSLAAAQTLHTEHGRGCSGTVTSKACAAVPHPRGLTNTKRSSAAARERTRIRFVGLGRRGAIESPEAGTAAPWAGLLSSALRCTSCGKPPQECGNRKSHKPVPLRLIETPTGLKVRLPNCRDHNVESKRCNGHYDIAMEHVTEESLRQLPQNVRELLMGGDACRETPAAESVRRCRLKQAGSRAGQDAGSYGSSGGG
eukprot:TRINITY_DN563_c0_g1_i2.p1 TRINITY_DN563_c0_g1~~TRINITY_DN563_c0_g1_i2.p1  ORF type:complete len:457 (-),score=72.48 TRINITY_DN563_c0_g1_i2:309-1679(-)